MAAGIRGGHLNSDGYRHISIDGRTYQEHHVIWLLAHGDWPKLDEIDHINGIKDDNRIENLRQATRSQNKVNFPRSRRKNDLPRGVVPHRGKFQARIKVNGKNLTLGTFSHPNAAHAAYLRAAQQYYKEFMPLATYGQMG